jgi:phosphohistidine phosphatase
MARQLWLLRHADAEPHGTRMDAKRRLTTRGESQARAAGLALAGLALDFDAALFSPKVRARQTAELVAERWGEQQRALLSEHPPLASGFDARGALAELAGLPADGRLLLVGHEPDLSSVIDELTGARVDLKKGGLAVVRVEDSKPRLDGVVGELAILLRPRELALIAGGVDGAPIGG